MDDCIPLEFYKKYSEYTALRFKITYVDSDIPLIPAYKVITLQGSKDHRSSSPRWKDLEIYHRPVNYGGR